MRSAVARRALKGAFPEWQAVYADVGIATFPVGADKRPMVKGWQGVTPKRSLVWATELPHANAFGFCPERAGITVLDVDSPDQAFADDLWSRFGRPVVIARTASGKFHGFYRRNGEGRLIRPEGHGLPYDVLGGGYSIAPGSVTPKGIYEIIEGSLADLGRLEPMEADAVLKPAPRPAANQNGMAIEEGSRNHALFRHLGPLARDHCDSLEALKDAAHAWSADNFASPMSQREIERTAESVWRLQTTGRNCIGQKGVRKVLLESGEMDRIRQRGGPGTMDAIGLYAATRERFGGFPEFSIANDAWRDEWTGDLSLQRLKRARQILLDVGVIKVRRGHSSKAGATLFSWSA